MHKINHLLNSEFLHNFIQFEKKNNYGPKVFRMNSNESRNQTNSLLY